jgi:hypothetical protein
MPYDSNKSEILTRIIFAKLNTRSQEIIQQRHKLNGTTLQNQRIRFNESG